MLWETERFTPQEASGDKPAAMRVYSMFRNSQLNRLRNTLIVVAYVLLTCAANGEDYPSKAIKLIVPTSPGGTYDKIARLIQRDFSANKRLAEKLVVLNVAGAGGTFGTTRIKDADADGYTIGLWNSGLVTSNVMGITDYDQSAFEIIGATGVVDLGLGVRNDSPYDSIESVVERLEVQPRSIKMATNLGLPVHFYPLLFSEVAGVEFQFVQVGGGSKRLASLLGGHTDVGQFSVLEFENFASTDSDSLGIRPLLLFSEKRSIEFPNVPTARELGYDLKLSESAFWLAPKNTPQERLDVIRNALRSAMQNPQLVNGLTAMGMRAEFIEPASVEVYLNKIRTLCEDLDENKLIVYESRMFDFSSLVITMTAAFFFLVIGRQVFLESSLPRDSELRFGRALIVVLIAFAYVATFPLLGFKLTTLLAAFLISIVLNGAKMDAAEIGKISIASVALGPGVGLFFETVLQVDLPSLGI